MSSFTVTGAGPGSAEAVASCRPHAEAADATSTAASTAPATRFA